MRLPQLEVIVSDNNRTLERRKAISEAFHTFHQPLTSLHCGLELALSKPRTEGEYRKRIEDALVNAGEILRLNKALRELVESTDPGERFGTVAFEALIAQLREEVALVAGATGVPIEFSGRYDTQVAADPMKLLMMLGNLISGVVAQACGGEPVTVTGKVGSSSLIMLVRSGGQGLAAEPSDMECKLREIRTDAGRAYVETIGGTFSIREQGFEIQLPVRN